MHLDEKTRGHSESVEVCRERVSEERRSPIKVFKTNRRKKRRKEGRKEGKEGRGQNFQTEGRKRRKVW